MWVARDRTERDLRFSFGCVDPVLDWRIKEVAISVFFPFVSSPVF